MKTLVDELDIEEAYCNHDCKLDEEHGCKVCEAYFNSRPCPDCMKVDCQCDNLYEQGK